MRITDSRFLSSFSAALRGASTPTPAEKPSAAAKLGYATGSAFAAPAPPASPKLSPNQIALTPQYQGNTNACGTTSLASVMTYWGIPRTHQQIDKSIRPFDMFTPPDSLVDYARANGMRAEMKVNSSLEDVARMVDQGVPPMVLIDPGSKGDFNLHYVTITGYNRGPDGKIKDVVIADPASGTTYKMDAKTFDEKWSSLKVANVGTGLNRVMITAVPNDGRTIVGADGVARKASDIKLPKSGFWDNVQSAAARGIASLVAGAAKLASDVWGGVKAVGSAVKKVVTKVGGAVKKAAGFLGGAVKKAAKAVASGVKKVAEAVGSAAKKVADAAAGAAKAVGDAFKKAWTSIF